MLKYAVLILWRKRGISANFYAFCISACDMRQVNESCPDLWRQWSRSQKGFLLFTLSVVPMYKCHLLTYF